MSLGVKRRRQLKELYAFEPERKRIYKGLEIPSQEIVCHLPRKYPVGSWDMEQDLKQERPTEKFSPQIMKEKPNSMIFPDNETVTIAQPCPRCIAGEPGHLGHIMNL